MERASQVELLSHRTIQTFARDPHVSEMFLFGSYEKKMYDYYSDMDVHVVSQNFDATMSQLWHALSDIGQVLVAFPLAARRFRLAGADATDWLCSYGGFRPPSCPGAPNGERLDQWPPLYRMILRGQVFVLTSIGYTSFKRVTQHLSNVVPVQI